MIVIIRSSAKASDKQKELIDWIESLGLEIHLSDGKDTTILGLVGDTTRVDIDILRSLDIVKEVLRVSEPYKQANRKFHPLNTVVSAGGAEVGNGFCFIAGPCSVESEEQIVSVAKAVKAAGAHILRGGAYKPRTSPYAFQGLKEDGIRLLLSARKVTGLPVVTEITAVSQLPLFADVDIIQVGARNMQNFELLKELGKSRKPILLKRGLSSTIDELLMSAEYILAGGNENIILCERGIRTFEQATRNTLDLSAVPVLKERTHLPVIVDPSHATGHSRYVRSMVLASCAAGADGVMTEVHETPEKAMCDGAQCIRPDAFGALVKDCKKIIAALK